MPSVWRNVKCLLTLVYFLEEDDQTKEARDGHLQSGMESGSAESLERLAEQLEMIA